MALTPAKHKELVGTLTGQTLKVYSAVPLDESWNTAAVLSELARLGFKFSIESVRKCLHNLQDLGLVLSSGNIVSPLWKRVAVKVFPDTPVYQLAETSLKEALPVAVSLIDRFSKLADLMRETAKQVEELGLLWEEEKKSLETKNQKLLKFREMFKNILEE